MNKLSQVARYKINLQKSAAFLHTNSEISKKRKKKISIYTNIRNNKILWDKFKPRRENICTLKIVTL